MFSYTVCWWHLSLVIPSFRKRRLHIVRERGSSKNTRRKRGSRSREGVENVNNTHYNAFSCDWRITWLAKVSLMSQTWWSIWTWSCSWLESLTRGFVLVGLTWETKVWVQCADDSNGAKERNYYYNLNMYEYTTTETEEFCFDGGVARKSSRHTNHQKNRADNFIKKLKLTLVVQSIY